MNLVKSESKNNSAPPDDLKQTSHQSASPTIGVGVSASPCYKSPTNIGNWGLSPISSSMVAPHSRPESMYPALYSASSPSDYFYVSPTHMDPAYRGDPLADWQQYCQLYYPSNCNLLTIRPNSGHVVPHTATASNASGAITDHGNHKSTQPSSNALGLVTSTSGDSLKTKYNKDVLNGATPTSNIPSSEMDLINSLTMGGSDSMNMIRCSTPEMMMALASLQDDKLKYGFNEKNESINLSTQNKYLKNDISLASVMSSDSGYSGSPGVHFVNQSSDHNDSVYPYVVKNVGVCSPNITPPKDFVSAARAVFPKSCSGLIKQQPFTASDLTSTNIDAKPTGIAKMLPHLQNFQMTKPPPAHGGLSANTKSCKRKADKMESSISEESATKRCRHNQPLNARATQIMSEWYELNLEHPYPNKAEKEWMSREGGISQAQLKSWFANKRNRSNNTRPKVEKRVMSEKLLNICHQLARDAQKPAKDNAFIIQQLSSIISSGDR